MLSWFKESQLPPEPHRCPGNYSTDLDKALRMALVGWMVPTRVFLLAVWSKLLQRWAEPTEQGIQEDCELKFSENQLLGTSGVFTELSNSSRLRSVWVSSIRPFGERTLPSYWFCSLPTPWWGIMRPACASKLRPKTCWRTIPVI